jgi:phosphoribosylformylglycinamidine synthase
MASEEFTEGSEQKRPNVQMGDPFMEKLLLEACLEAMATGAVLGIQDMGAAGLTCSTCEMGGRGELGLTVELDLVPQRETGMTSYEIMLSESQERMLLVADKPRAQEVLDVFKKWGLDASIVGTVTAKPNMVITQHGELMADIPNKSLTDDAPVYHRPVGTWKAPVPLDPPADVLAELKKPRDYTADLKKLLASANICDKRWVYEQYDSMVQTNTVQGPGAEAGVMRIKGTGSAGHERGLAMALAGNGRWTYLDPKVGAMHAVAEAARKVACTGATPVAATNCLNFGNPEKPEIMAQLSNAIDGIAEACTALGTPITGGNVSLYNETKGEGIYPTPVLGIVGIIEDVTKSVPSGFRKGGERILLLSVDFSVNESKDGLQSFGSSDYAKAVLNSFWGKPPELNIAKEAELHKCLAALADQRLITSASDVSDGGIAVTLAKASFVKGVGAAVSLDHIDGDIPAAELFNEEASAVVVTCTDEAFAQLTEVCGQFGSITVRDIGTTGGPMLDIFTPKGSAVSASVATLKAEWAGALDAQLADEVVTA